MLIDSSISVEIIKNLLLLIFAYNAVFLSVYGIYESKFKKIFENEEGYTTLYEFNSNPSLGWIKGWQCPNTQKKQNYWYTTFIKYVFRLVSNIINVIQKISILFVSCPDSEHIVSLTDKKIKTSSFNFDLYRERFCYSSSLVVIYTINSIIINCITFMFNNYKQSIGFLLIYSINTSFLFVAYNFIYSRSRYKNKDDKTIENRRYQIGFDALLCFFASAIVFVIMDLTSSGISNKLTEIIDFQEEIKFFLLGGFILLLLAFLSTLLLTPFVIKALIKFINNNPYLNREKLSFFIKKRSTYFIISGIICLAVAYVLFNYNGKKLNLYIIVYIYVISYWLHFIIPFVRTHFNLIFECMFLLLTSIIIIFPLILCIRRINIEMIAIIFLPPLVLWMVFLLRCLSVAGFSHLENLTAKASPRTSEYSG